MKRLVTARVLALATALCSALVLGAVAQAHGSSRASHGALVALRKTALGTILVDGRGRTLYLFERDRKGASRCNAACLTYWPPLTSTGTPRAGKGVQRSMLGLTHSGGRARQVTYAGHPLYLFVGDKRPGDTAGEGLKNFGAEWYAVGANGHTVEQGASGSSGSPSGPSYGGGY